MAERVPTQDETLALITAKAKEVGDSFFVKIFRKAHAGGLPESVASFDEAQVEHIISPERWLPALAGGGPIFMLQIYHSADRGTVIGGPLQFSVPTSNLAPKQLGDIDPRIVKTGSWAGPRNLVFPRMADKAQVPEAPLFSMGSAAGMPPVPASGNSAANNVPGAGLPGAVFRDLAAERNQALLDQIASERAALQRQREEFAEQNRREREELAEQKRRTELEAVKREAAAQIQQMEAKMLAALDRVTAATAAPKTDITQTIAVVIGAVSPLLMKMSESATQLRIEMMKSQEASAAVAAESNRTLMTAMMQKPAIDPVMERLFNELKNTIEKTATQQVPQSTMLHSMSEAMASMTQTTMDLVQTAADLNLGGGRQEDHPALKAIREGVKGIQSLFAGYQASLPRGPQPQYQLPQARPPAQAQQQRPPQAQVHALPQAPQASAPQPQVQEQQVVVLPEPKDVVDHLENLFKAKAPVQEVVKTFIDAYLSKDPALDKALDEVDGEVEELFSRRLSGFVMANPDYVPYLRELLREVNDKGAVAGIFEPDDDDGRQEDQDPEEHADDAA